MPRKLGYVRASRNAFVALLPQLREEWAKGRSMHALHEEFKERLGIGYIQFTRYCKKYRQALGEDKLLNPTVATAEYTSGEYRQRREPIMVTDEPAKTFHFDPLDAYRKKFD